MRRYVTEKVGIVELFQVIVIFITVALAIFGFTKDMKWNVTVEDKGVNVCININQQICKRGQAEFQKLECEYLKLSQKECGNVINEEYLRPVNSTYVEVHKGHQPKDISEFLDRNMKRNEITENSFRGLIILIAVSVCVHLIMATLSKNIELKTKWNAALQGIVLFSSGYAAVLMAIATNHIDVQYVKVATHLRPCGILRLCDRNVDPAPELNQTFVQLNVITVLDDFAACQGVHVKKAICLLLVIIIAMCIAIILMAMELTTKYEEESNEEETAAMEGGLENLIEDQTFHFDHHNSEISDTPTITKTPA